MKGGYVMTTVLQTALYTGHGLDVGPSAPGVQVPSSPPWPALGCYLAVPKGCTLFRAYYYKKYLK